MEFLAYLDLALWLYLLLGRGGFWLPCFHDAARKQAPLHWPQVCAVIPARNEADTLGDALPGLLGCDYPSLRVVLVDDRSEDATSTAAARIAQACNASERLSIVKGRPLPGWKGKVAAMQCGLERIAEAGDPPHYVLFTDADILYEKDALKPLVADAEAGGFVLSSLMVKLRCKSLAERWLIPAFVYFFQMLYPFSRVNQPRCKTAAAAGGCMLVRYDALMKAGGLAPIRAALIDDCALGRLMKRHGPVSLRLTRHVHSVRPYPRLGDIRSMVARTAYDQLGYSPTHLALTLLGLMIVFIAPAGLALFAVGKAQLLGLISWACMSITFIPLLRLYGRSMPGCITLPAIALFYMAFTLDSAWQYSRGRGGVWKGRVQAARMQGL